MDKFTLRGIIYSSLSTLGLGYELYAVHPPRMFLIVMYSLVIVIGLLCIFAIEERS